MAPETRLTRILAIVATALLLASCAAQRPALSPADPHWKDEDRDSIPDPGSRESIVEWETVERLTFEQAEQVLDLNRSFRKIGGVPEEAWNINSVDEVPNSSWYTNRHHLIPMTADEIKAGYQVTGGPDKSAPWTVFRPKVGGVTAGFWIKDSHGNQYILKFDPPGFPDLATAAAAMAGRFFYACGYNVPEETITSFRPEELVIGEGVTYKDKFGIKHPFTREKLNQILELAHKNDDGSIRCLASLALPNVRGPFSFDGVRKNDPNDWCLHEHRRELRALYVLCSFVNHWDIKDQNSMDTYADEGGRRFLKHHLLDFGSTFGSAGHGPQDVHSGYANQVDLRDAFVSYLTLGLKKWQWEDAKPFENPSIGYFESEIFHPAKWDPIYPIPAFENITGRDGYWGAKLVMAFTDDDLRALIEAGRYSDPEAAAYMLETLRVRRNKIGMYWFGKVNPLDHFGLREIGDGIELVFDDLASLYGLSTESESEYTVLYDHKPLTDPLAFSTSPLVLNNDMLSELAAHYRPGRKDSNLYEIRISTTRDGIKSPQPVVVWLWYHEDSSRWQLVGVEHLD